jgi:hypothetical protein
MPIYRFRIYFEEDESVYRDVAIRHDQTFQDLHLQILKSFEFDTKHRATFHRSNDNWQQGREISLERYEDRAYRVEPLLMAETRIVSEIRNPNQKFLYTYDFTRNWPFLVELISISNEANPKLTYPATVRKEGIGPSQYGTKSILGDRFIDVEEKYDLGAASEGFGEEGEEAASDAETEDGTDIPADDEA